VLWKLQFKTFAFSFQEHLQNVSFNVSFKRDFKFPDDPRGRIQNLR
jgi:hypothetical protein